MGDTPEIPVEGVRTSSGVANDLQGNLYIWQH